MKKGKKSNNRDTSQKSTGSSKVQFVQGQDNGIQDARLGFVFSSFLFPFVCAVALVVKGASYNLLFSPLAPFSSCLILVLFFPSFFSLTSFSVFSNASITRKKVSARKPESRKKNRSASNNRTRMFTFTFQGYESFWVGKKTIKRQAGSGWVLVL